MTIAKKEKIALLNSIVHHDTKDVLDRLHKYVSSGTDIKRLTEDMLSILKDVLIYNSSYNGAYLEILKEDEAQDVTTFIDNETAIKMIDVLMEAIKDFKNVTSITSLFEITLLKLTSAEAASAKPRATQNATYPASFEQKPVQKPVFEQPKPEPVVAPQPAPVVEEPKKEEKVEEIKEEPVSSSIQLNDSVIYLKDAEDEDYFRIDEDLMIKVMVCSKKAIKDEITDGWKNIKKYMANSTVGKAASLLIDGHPLVASNKIVVIEYQLPKMADKINLKSNQLELQTVLSLVFKRKMFVYAVSRSTSVDLQNQYMSLLQIGKLPKAKDITLEFEGE